MNTYDRAEGKGGTDEPAGFAEDRRVTTRPQQPAVASVPSNGPEGSGD